MNIFYLKKKVEGKLRANAREFTISEIKGGWTVLVQNIKKEREENENG
jgi:hypothetical protein